MRYLYWGIWFFANLYRQLLLGHWWQIKEYRFDRFAVFLTTKDAHTHLQTPLLAAKILVLAGYYFVNRNLFYYIYLFLLLIEMAYLISNTSTSQLKKPKLSLRGLALLGASLGFLLVTSFFILKTAYRRYYLGFDLLGYLVAPIFILATSLLVRLIVLKNQKLVHQKLRLYHPQVIAITGSYGKSSTKHLLHQLLKTQSSVVETPASYNTPLGIIKTVKTLINKPLDYFLVEMGAYRPGEIKSLCKLTPPSVSLITGIAPQHLALFGSIDKLLKAKYEIVTNLPGNNPLFINVSQPATLPLVNLAQQEKRRLYTYALTTTKNLKADFLSTITKTSSLETKFSLQTPTEAYQFTTNLTTTSLLENLTGALAVAFQLKIPYSLLQKRVSNLDAVDNSLKKVILSSKITLLDDSYNINPVGFEAALKELRKYPGRRIVISNGFLELGKMEKEINLQLSQLLKNIDLVLTTSPQFAKSAPATLIKPAVSLQQLASLLQPPATILLEGRLPLSLVTNLKKLQ